MQVAVDATELLAGLDHARRAQRSAICPSCQRLTLPACSRQIEIIESMVSVLRRVRARVGGTPSRSTVRSRPDPRAGWPRRQGGLGELSGQCLKLRLGIQGRGGMVGDPHATLDRAAQPLGELVADVSDLVLLASGEHGMVEQVEHGAA